MSPLPVRDLFLALLVVAVWGTNFVLIQIGLRGVPPLLLCTLRFFLVCFPFVFFIPKPNTSWSNIAIYGLSYFALQFAFLFTGMSMGVSAGLASLLLQTQVFFTMTLSALFLKERITWWRVIGALVAFQGIVVVALNAGGDASLGGLFMILAAAFSFSVGSITSRRMSGANPVALVVWGSLVAFPVLLILSLIVEGPEKIATAWYQLNLASVAAISYIVYLSTHLGFTIWNILLSRHPAAVIAPFTLLVPVFGFISAVVFLGESFPSWKILAAVLVIVGLCLNQAGGHLANYLRNQRNSGSGRN